MARATKRRIPFWKELRESHPADGPVWWLNEDEMDRFVRWGYRINGKRTSGPGGCWYVDLPASGKFAIRHWPRSMHTRGQTWFKVGERFEVSINPENCDLPGKLYGRKVAPTNNALGSAGDRPAALSGTPAHPGPKASGGAATTGDEQP